MNLQTRSSLVDDVRAGKPLAWVEFDKLYRPMVRLYITRFRIQDSDAEDLSQEVFTKLQAQLASFKLDHSKGKFRGWLRLVTDNTVRDWLKRRKRQEGVVATKDAHDLAQQFSQAENDDRIRQLEWRRAVLDLVVRQVREEFKGREGHVFACFEQLHLQNRPAKEVAADLKIKVVNNVYVYAHRVLKRVREVCEGYDEELSGDSTDGSVVL